MRERNLEHEEGIGALSGAIWKAVHYLEHNSLLGCPNGAISVVLESLRNFLQLS
ncbi:hypothetical protein LINGRAHAP2_LOCUS35029 [Linum grandiflorum]